jgi:hypothetical protein
MNGKNVIDDRTTTEINLTGLAARFNTLGNY